jgi:hypothetical protein
MANLRFIVSRITKDNDYQLEQAAVAQAAVTAKVGWAVLNREADYIPKLRSTAGVPVFLISSDHREIGRIQGRQFAAMLPKGRTRGRQSS